MHVHADEQPREIEDCVAEHGRRPIELLAETGCLGARTTIVHATHASDAELDLVADSGAGVCICPTTEANLGDGFAPVARLLRARYRSVDRLGLERSIDPFEELRELEGIARRWELRRNVIGPDELFRIGSEGGAAALGLTEWDGIEIDLTHRSLAGVSPDEIRGALVFGCAADVVTQRGPSGPQP